MKFLSTIEIDANDPVAASAAARVALREAKVVWMKPTDQPADLRGYYDTLVERVGDPISIAEDFRQGGKQTGERWMEIRYDVDIPDMEAFRYSKNAQPFHTDESYVSDPADIMLFYCVNRAPSGGATIFIDGEELIETLRAEDPELLEALTSTTVCYAKADDRRELPIISRLPSGQAHLNYNYYCAGRDQSTEALELNQRFFDFLEAKRLSRDLLVPVALNPGESVAWWDNAVLHGRDAFDANESDDRLIWKAGIRFADEPALA